MIKLKNLINELSVKKNTWTPIPSGELDDFKKIILDLIKTAYKPIGGHPNYKNTGDVKSSENFEVFDFDYDDDVDVVLVTKNRPAGKKAVAIGHDGSKKSKSLAINKQTKELKKSGHYVEVSGKPKDIFLSNGVAIVNDENTVRKVLKGKEIKWHSDGTYDRKIGGGWHRKTLMGKPKV